MQRFLITLAVATLVCSSAIAGDVIVETEFVRVQGWNGWGGEATFEQREVRRPVIKEIDIPVTASSLSTYYSSSGFRDSVSTRGGSSSRNSIGSSGRPKTVNVNSHYNNGHYVKSYSRSKPSKR